MFPVELFRATLRKFTAILQRHEIRFHLTGGIAGTVYGEPRLTQDIDIVIDPVQTQNHLDALIASLNQSELLFNEQALRQAVATSEMFQLLDQQECLKLDVYPREMIPGELNRSTQIEVFAGEMLPVVSRVDAAASKLMWISKGSHKSRRDLRVIFRLATSAQQQAIQSWADSTGQAELLGEVLREADEI